jgi:hypothetical protein
MIQKSTIIQGVLVIGIILLAMTLYIIYPSVDKSTEKSVSEISDYTELENPTETERDAQYNETVNSVIKSLIYYTILLAWLVILLIDIGMIMSVRMDKEKYGLDKDII